jgi:hypothetical protein
VPHIIEIWTMAADGRSTYTAACLSCGWVGERRTRPEAESEGRLHEEADGSPPQISSTGESRAKPARRRPHPR